MRSALRHRESLIERDLGTLKSLVERDQYARCKEIAAEMAGRYAADGIT